MTKTQPWYRRATTVTGAVVMGAMGMIAANARAQCSQDWIGGESYPGVNDAVGASLVWDRDGAGPLPPMLVVAGDFTLAGPLGVGRIAMWDGTRWTAPFGAGLNGPVRALTILNGDLVAAGEFTQAGGVPAAQIARWDGSAWSAIGTGMDGPVYAAAVLNGVLYAGGNFAHAGGAVTSGIARWDGSAWSPVGLSGVDGTVSAMCVFNNALYVGGQFTHADAAASPGIAGWNGTSWFALGTGVSPADVKSLNVSGGVLCAGGAFVNAGGLAAYGVARWNGTAWSNTGLGVYLRTCVRYSCTNHPYQVAALGSFGSLEYAFTDSTFPLTFHSSGAAWTSGGTLASPALLPRPITTAQEFNGQFYLGGTFSGESSPRNFARLNGTQWSQFNGMDGPVEGFAAYNNGLVAVGNFTQIDGVGRNHVAFWDGAAWSNLSAGVGHSTSATTLNGVLYVSVPGGVQRWDGAAWTSLSGGTLLNFNVAPVVTTWNSQLVAGASSGAFGTLDGNTSTVGSWNGSTWVPLGELTGLTFGPHPLATVGTTLYAATYFTGTSSIGQYSGGDWTGIDTTPLGTVVTLLTHNNALHAAGQAADGTGVVGWLNGTTWQILGGTFDTNPSALASVNGSLYALGGFTSIDGAPFKGVARWDGTAWQPLGSGANGVGTAGSVLALAGLNGNVVAGGDFFGIGGKGYSRFAVYGCIPTPPCPADFNHSGGATVQDIFDFLTAWFGAAPGADFNGVGGVTVQDIFDFLAAWFAGCP